MHKINISQCASRDSNTARSVPPEVILDRHHSRLLTRLLQKQILVASASAPASANAASASTSANVTDQQRHRG